jgi:hypothetical protein
LRECSEEEGESEESRIRKGNKLGKDVNSAEVPSQPKSSGA